MGLSTANHKACDVSVLGGASNELVELSHDSSEGKRRSLLERLGHQGEQAFLSKFLSVLIASLGDTIGIDNQNVAGIKHGPPGLLLFVSFDSQGDAFGLQAFNGSVAVPQHRRIVARAKVIQ